MLRGTYTALVTPFSSNQVDYNKIAELVEEQIQAGVEGIVPVGTTGESPTVTFEEHPKVVEQVVKTANGRCTVIAGTGGNATEEAVNLTKIAASAGADATLQVTPYYNKPTQEGLYRHFSTVAEQGGLPVVLYNVPGRTGKEIEVDTIARLANHENVVAVKEASPNVDRVSQLVNQCNITLLSGDDSLTLPRMSVGAEGVISVVSNIVPARVAAMVNAALGGDLSEASRLHKELFPLYRDLFIETNPIPIKAAMAMAGKIEEEYRLPLCPLGSENRATLKKTLSEAEVC